MSEPDRGKAADAAEVYDEFFVPALFEQWTDVVLDVGRVRPGQRVLDVGSGTGVLARAARDRVGDGGEVAAIDPNDGMLAVARRIEPGGGLADRSRGAAPVPTRVLPTTEPDQRSNHARRPV